MGYDAYYFNITEHYFPVCYDISKGPDTYIERVTCASSVTQHAKECVEAECLVPCNDVQYQLTTSSAAWPDPLAIQQFYNYYIDKQPFAARYNEAMTSVQNQLFSKKRSETIQLLQQTEVTKHFLKAKFVVGGYYLPKLVQKPAMSFTSLVAAIGGSLNLYLGISVVVIIELSEFLFNLFKTHANPSPTAVIEVKPQMNKPRF